MTRNITKIRVLAWIMLIASIMTCAFGIYMIAVASAEVLHLISEGEAVRAHIAPLVTELAEGLVFAIHYFFVSKFLIHSLKHGVPFTHEGAKEIKILALETIFFPILAAVASAIAYAGIRHPLMSFTFSIYEIVLGVGLLMMSYVVEYGTNKIEGGHFVHEALKYIIDKYPDVASEAKDAIIANGVKVPEHSEKLYRKEHNK